MRPEALQARPQAEVGLVGHLRLQPDQVLERIGHRHPPAFEEHLALEEGPVQRARAEDAHRPISPVGTPKTILSPGASVRERSSPVAVET